MKIVDVKLKGLKPWPQNPRVMSRHDMESLKRSLQTYGFVEPVVVNKRTGLVVGGHQRLQAAEALGLKTVPVTYVDLDDKAAAALGIALNRVAGDWDEPKLEALLAEFKDDKDWTALTGFTTTELDQMLAEFAGETPEGGVARGDDEIGTEALVEFTVLLAPPDYSAVMNRLAKTGKSTPGEQLVELCRRSS